MIEAGSPPWPERPALFLDLDGTLLEFASEPQSVVTSARLHRLLEQLPDVTSGALAIISGRTIHDVDEILTPHRFAIGGVHGNERRSSDGQLSTVESDPAALDETRSLLRRFAAENPDVLIEDKQLSIALHYRKRPDLQEAVERLGREISATLSAHLELLTGKMVVEVKPASMHKGSAIHAFMSEQPFSGRTPVFIGDDDTDEVGFGVINDFGGISIKVSSGESQAKWRLRDVDAVLSWLEARVEEG